MNPNDYYTAILEGLGLILTINAIIAIHTGLTSKYARIGIDKAFGENVFRLIFWLPILMDKIIDRYNLKAIKESELAFNFCWTASIASYLFVICPATAMIAKTTVYELLHLNPIPAVTVWIGIGITLYFFGSKDPTWHYKRIFWPGAIIAGLIDGALHLCLWLIWDNMRDEKVET